MSSNAQVKCKICNNIDTEFITEMEISKKIIKFIRCNNCGFVFNYPVPDKKWLDWFYLDSPAAKKFNIVHLPGNKNEFKLWERRLKGVLRYKKNGNFLDIGCGKGFLLSIAQKQGFKVFGTEFSQGEIEYCKKYFKLDKIYLGDLENANFRNGYFDVITLFHVLEHIIDLQSYLREIKRTMAKDGILVIEVPNKDWLGRPSYNEKLAPYMIHHNHFSAKNLSELLNQQGFKILEFSYDNPFRVGFLNKWTIISFINSILFKLHFYNLSPVIKIYVKK